MNYTHYGNAGIPFALVKEYKSYAAMLADFKSGDLCTDVRYGEYVIISNDDPENLDFTHNGAIYRRGYNYWDEETGGAVFISNISESQNKVTQEAIEATKAAQSATKAMTELHSTVESNESDRVEKEKNRVLAENIRELSEQQRQANESNRQDTIATWDEAIDDLPSYHKRMYNLEDNTLEKEVVASNNMINEVPAEKMTYCSIEEIGGMSHKSENLIPFDYKNRTQTNSGITYVSNLDGSITINGTAEKRVTFVLYQNPDDLITKVGNVYTSSLPADGNGVYLQINYFNQDGVGTEGQFRVNVNSTTTKIIPEGWYGSLIFLGVEAGTVVNNVTVYPMLNRGETALPYEPYFAGFRDTKVTEVQSKGIDTQIIETLPIPAGVQNLDGYGQGINEEYYNKVILDPKNNIKKFVQKTKRIVFNGTESWDWAYYPLIITYVGNNPSIRGCPIISTHGLRASIANIEGTGIGFSNMDTLLPQITTLDEWKTYLAEQYAAGTPVTIEYALATPIETDLSSYFTDDNMLKTEEGGTLTFVNEYNYDVPNTISYTKKKDLNNIYPTKEEVQQQLEALKQDIQSSGIYSVRFSGSDPNGIREDDAVGMIAEVAVDDEIVQNDFDNVPFFDRPICNCTWDKTAKRWIINAYKGELGFAWDGSNGEVMYECTPFYYKADFSGEGAPHYVSVTGTPHDGYELAPMFKNGYDKVYCPCFQMARKDGVVISAAGLQPETVSLNSAMAAARSFDENACTETIECYFSDTLLLLVEFATKNWQFVMRGVSELRYGNDSTYDQIIEVLSSNQFTMPLGKTWVKGQTIAIGSSAYGTQRVAYTYITDVVTTAENTVITIDREVSTMIAGDWISSRMWKTGDAAMAVSNASSGVASIGSSSPKTDGRHPIIWRGKEHPWGNGFSTLSNLLVTRTGEGTTDSPYAYKMHYLNNPVLYDGTLNDNYIETNFDCANSDGYSKTLSCDSRYPFVFCTSEVGAASNTYNSAYYYCHYNGNTNTLRVVRVGGDFSNGSSCGLYFTLSDPPGASSINCAAHVLCM